MDVVERIKTELAAGPVVLFMKGTPDFPQCGFSAQTVGALRALGAEFRYINIFEEPELREALKRFSNWPTYPQLYVKGELVGGCDIVLEMYRSRRAEEAARRSRRRQLSVRGGGVVAARLGSSRRVRASRAPRRRSRASR